MVIFDNAKLFDFRWDGATKHLLELDPDKPHIWSSSTLYNDEIKNKRITWFQNWLAAEQEKNAAEILKFHKTAGADDKENGLIMSRNNNLVCTVSITQIIKKDLKFLLKYFDRINNQNTERILDLRNL